MVNNIVPNTPSPTWENYGNTQFLFGYNERLSEDISSNFPFYDNYEDFAENERHIAKEASIIPEFAISEYMDYYVEENAGNFRTKNKKFLSLLGAEASSSAESEVSIRFSQPFEESHLVSEKLENLKKILRNCWLK